MMTQTNGKYTYEDMQLRKRVLRQEIQDMEKMVTLSVPKTLGLIGGNIKDKTLEIIQGPNSAGLLLDVGITLGTELLISRFINKKSIMGKAALMASAYLIPLAVNETKKLIVKVARKNHPKIIDINEVEDKD